MADITSRRMGVFSRIKIDVPSGMASTNRSLGSQPVSIPPVWPVASCSSAAARTATSARGGPFSSVRRYEQDAALDKRMNNVVQKEKIKEKFR